MELYQLRQRQSLSLKEKIIMSELRIRDWHTKHNGKVYISFSGGKDSTVLLNLVRKRYPNVPAVFVDTGLEYPEIRDFVKTFDNVIWLKPKMTFPKVLEKYGYPILSKATARKIDDLKNSTSQKQIDLRWNGDARGKMGKLSEKWRYLVNEDFKVSNKCCDIMKKRPFKEYQKETKRVPLTGTMTEESEHRKINYLKNGCNNFDSKRPISNPLSVWLEKDIWEYIEENNLEYCDIYKSGEITRTGCMFCMFGVHLEQEPNRFQLMQKTHPKQYDYCINKLGLGAILDKIGVNYTTDQLDLFDMKKEPRK